MSAAERERAQFEYAILLTIKEDANTLHTNDALPQKKLRSRDLPGIFASWFDIHRQFVLIEKIVDIKVCF